jgi:hypothetical protein
MTVTVSNLFADTINAVEAAATYHNSVKDDKSLREASTKRADAKVLSGRHSRPPTPTLATASRPERLQS